MFTKVIGITEEKRMQNNKLVSIIIPVLNSIDGLDRCLQSVARQDYEQKEVIVVDDDSRDGSLELARQYEEKYSFVKVLRGQNRGVSAARNLGLSHAGGEMIRFVDSDDTLPAVSCRHMVERMERDQSDLVIAGYYNEKKQREIRHRECLWENRESFMQAFPELFTGSFLNVPWNKLYRREVLERGFPEDLDRGEDLVCNLSVFRRARRISMLDETVYHYYNVNDSSLSSRFREEEMEIEDRLFGEVKMFYMECGEGEASFLYPHYLTAIRESFIHLVLRYGGEGRLCKQRIRNWLSKESVKELYLHKEQFGRRDRILLALMQRGMAAVLYYYYRAKYRV